MNSLTLDAAGFRERFSLADKHLVYVFSLDVAYRVTSDAKKAGWRLSAIEAAESSTYHVRDEAVTTCAAGVRHDIPRVRVVCGEDRMELGSCGIGEVNGALLLHAASDPTEPLRIDYSGIAYLPRGFEHLRDDGRLSQLPGTACITTRQACIDPRYRWLTEQPLFGFGQVFLEHDARPSEMFGAPPAVNRLRFSFDLYSGM